MLSISIGIHTCNQFNVQVGETRSQDVMSRYVGLKLLIGKSPFSVRLTCYYHISSSKGDFLSQLPFRFFEKLEGLANIFFI